jgi:hypothetical protein
MPRSARKARRFVLPRPVLRFRGQVSAAKRAANRRNARRSTGPRTAAGKARAARNARRHGLTVSPLDDLAFMRAAAALARMILQMAADPESRSSENAPRHLQAMQVAIAHIRVLQVRKAKQALHGSGLEWDELTRQLQSLDRYEGRALARRKMAMRRFDEPDGEFSPTRQNEATAANKSAISIGWIKNPTRRRRSRRRSIRRQWLREWVRRPHNGYFAAKSPRRLRRIRPLATAGASGNEIKERFRAPREGKRAGKRQS